MAYGPYTGTIHERASVPIEIDGVADTQADWTSVPNDSYFLCKVNDAGQENLIYYKNSSGVVLEQFTELGTDSNIIYVDSETGADATGRGSYGAKYATVSYALSDITYTDTFGCDTNSNTTLDGILDADYADLKVGQIITGTGIPYNSVIVSLDGGAVDAKAVSISKSATATATITATWWNWTIIKTSGPVTITSSIDTEGVGFDFGESQVIYGNVTVFDRVVARITPEYVVGGHWHGTHVNSRIYEGEITASSHDAIYKLKTVYSIGTNEQFDCNNQSRFRNLTFECDWFDARFGKIAKIDVSDKVSINISGYGSTGGIVDSSESMSGRVEIETPSSVNAFTSTADYLNISGNILGSLTINPSSPRSVTFNASVKGTFCTLSGSGSVERLVTFNGSMDMTTFSLSGNMVLNGTTLGSITQTSGNIQVMNYKGSDITISGSSVTYIKHISNTTVPAIDLSGSVYLTYEDHLYSAYDINATLDIGSGCRMISTHNLNVRINSLAGTLVVRGHPKFWQKSAEITGTLKSEGARIRLFRSGAEGSNNTPCLQIGDGGEINLDGGQIDCPHGDSKSGLIRKNQPNSKLFIRGQFYYKAENGLAPLQILSNTGTAPDVYDFSTTGMGAAGFQLDDTFSDTTYGTAYAPNMIVGGTYYEDSSYDIKSN